MSNRNRESEMSNKTEHDLDMALAALARETAPLPDRKLGEAVLTDAALTIFAREAMAAAPQPGPDLVARVLGDAAEIAAGRNALARTASPARDPELRASTRRIGLIERLFGWQAGMAAVMMLALGFGVGIGLEIEPEALPLLDHGRPEAPIIIAALDEDFMGIDGL